MATLAAKSAAGRKFRCQFCKQPAKSEASRHAHEKLKHRAEYYKDAPIKCDIGDCKERFFREAGLAQHKRKAHGILSEAAKKKEAMAQLLHLNYCPHCGEALPNAIVGNGNGRK